MRAKKNIAFVVDSTGSKWSMMCGESQCRTIDNSAIKAEHTCNSQNARIDPPNIVPNGTGLKSLKCSEVLSLLGKAQAKDMPSWQSSTGL